jgi:hypothetical protein
MPSLPPYIPNKDAAFDAWLQNFSTLLTANPTLYGQTAGAASTVAGQQSAWANAYALVTSPATKTKTTVAAKNAARVTASGIVRPYAVEISLNAGVSSANKTAIGVNPRTSVPTPVTTPTTYPALTITQALPLQTVVAYRDQLASPSVKSKPYGVTALQLFASASATPITDPTLLNFIGVNTKSPFAITWDSSKKGMQGYFAARWQTRKGLVGPWGPIVNFTIAG